MLNIISNFISSPETQIMLWDSAQMFVHLFLELTILFLVISYIVGLINQKLPKDQIQKLLGARKGRGYFMAAGLGAITPFCSCSTIPMLVGLLKARAGFGPTMTFLFTSPLLNPIVIALFIPVLGAQVTLWYAVLALVTSIVAGATLEYLGFDRFIKKELLGEKPSTCQSSCGTETETACSSQEKNEVSIWRKAWQESWSLFLPMLPYMTIAMLIGAFVHGFVPADFFADIASSDNPLAVPAAALVGIPLYIRVTALLPLVSSFMAKGVSIGAIIALIIGSGGASIPEVILLRRLFYWPLLASFLGVIFSMAILGGFAFNHFFS